MWLGVLEVAVSFESVIKVSFWFASVRDNRGLMADSRSIRKTGRSATGKLKIGGNQLGGADYLLAGPVGCFTTAIKKAVR
jgi:hypothetical protein